MKGLYPKVLEELLIRRNSLKRRLAPLKDKKEELEKEINAKQLALKVYINTFYGEAGNSGSPFFLRPLAGRVTSAGQQNIKLIADLVRRKISKEKYWEEMVRISIKAMSELRGEVNAFLREDNGSSYLKMVYEEVLFPIVKRGQYKHFREVGKKVMDESMRLDNTRTLRQIVKDVFKEIINGISQIDLNGVIKTAVWKPDKNNKSVQRFISRMRDRHTREKADAKRLIKKGLTPEPYLYEIPELGERFEYIVVENDSSQRVGDKMEYPEVVRRLGKKIDISYYLKTVVGLCARFINYDNRHQPSSEIVLGALKKLKDGNKAGDSKADDGGVDGDDLDEDEDDENEMDEDE
ncbi:hypothetical protein C1645_839340, partial [Glomus cerebriforme]